MQTRASDDLLRCRDPVGAVELGRPGLGDLDLSRVQDLECRTRVLDRDGIFCHLQAKSAFYSFELWKKAV